MDTNNTTEESIFSEEYRSDSSTESSSTSEDRGKEIDSSLDNIIMDDQNYSMTKPWRRIIKAVIKNG
jgi:hypothetical protein